MVPKQVVPDRRGLVEIGKIKENLVTEVAFDCADLGDGSGAYAVVFQRPKDAAPYPVAFRAEWPSIVWVVQAADTAKPGTGKVEIRWYGDGDQVGKSKTYMVRITDGLPDPTEAPEAWEGFMGQVARDAQAAKDAAGEAKANADGAAASAGIAQGAATEAGKLAGAAGDAANAAAAAASAATSAQAGAESAERNAQAAAEAAETARNGAEAAKLAAGESATGAAGSAEAAAQAAQKGQALYDQVKDDLAAGKLKGEKGDKGDPGEQGPQGEQGPAGPAGKDGLDAPQIDDAVISAENPWSSRKIIETLCPPLEVTGNPVTCEPVAGYPLGVVASWEPTQAGTGDPSPENIRPISGREAVTVQRCGENLLKITPFATAVNKGVTFEYVPDGGIRIQGTASANTDSPTFPVRHLPPGKYYGLDMGTGIAASIVVQRAGKRLWLNAKGTFEIIKGDIVKYWYMIVDPGYTANKTVYPYIVPGTTAPTAYTPYRGDTLALALPRMVYGGSMDAVTGEGLDEARVYNLPIAKMNNSEEYPGWVALSEMADILDVIGAGLNTADPNETGIFLANVCGMINTTGRIGVNTLGTNRVIYLSKSYFRLSQSEWKEKYPDLVVQIAVRRKSPTPFRATGNGPIMPIPGETNTVMTDADSVTVTGRADPIRIIQQLQSAQSAAAAQLDETQQAMVDTTAMAVDYIYEQDSKIFGGEENDNETDTAATDVP